MQEIADAIEHLSLIISLIGLAIVIALGTVAFSINKIKGE
jgi:hypothetical protein